MKFHNVGKLMLVQTEKEGKTAITVGYLPLCTLVPSDDTLHYFAHMLSAAFDACINSFPDSEQITAREKLKSIFDKNIADELILEKPMDLAEDGWK